MNLKKAFLISKCNVYEGKLRLHGRVLMDLKSGDTLFSSDHRNAVKRQEFVIEKISAYRHEFDEISESMTCELIISGEGLEEKEDSILYIEKGDERFPNSVEGGDSMLLELIEAYDHAKEVGELFSEYTNLLIAGEPSFKKYLDIQNYEEELAYLESKYGAPWGRLYLAYWDGKLAGCVGLRKLDGPNCEMKRLYVRPNFRGKHIGKELVERIIKDAREIGYSHILLDTLPFLKEAIHLYETYGFYKTESYNNSPVETSVYMRLDL